MVGDFGANFWKKAWAIVQGTFQNFSIFLKWPKLEKLKSKSAQTFCIHVALLNFIFFQKIMSEIKKYARPVHGVIAPVEILGRQEQPSSSKPVPGPPPRPTITTATDSNSLM